MNDGYLQLMPKIDGLGTDCNRLWMLESDSQFIYFFLHQLMFSPFSPGLSISPTPFLSLSLISIYSLVLVTLKLLSIYPIPFRPIGRPHFTWAYKGMRFFIFYLLFFLFALHIFSKIVVTTKYGWFGPIGITNFLIKYMISPNLGLITLLRLLEEVWRLFLDYQIWLMWVLCFMLLWLDSLHIWIFE